MEAVLWIVGLLLLACIGLLVAGRSGLFMGVRPSDLGVHDGKLKPPSPTRNSVCSQADRWRNAPQRRYAMIEPLRYDGEPAQALPRLIGVLRRMDGARIVEVGQDYVYAQFTTRWLRFVDDAEFLLSPGEGMIHVRSAARFGREDFGRNRRRVDAIRADFERE